MNLLPLLAALFTNYLNQTAPLPNEETGVASMKPAAAENVAQVQEKIKGNDAYWSAPFVLADLEKKVVTVWGQHTGMGLNEPLEFFVISELSGHDYESLMISFAKPSDIHAALEKIGAQAGAPVSPDDHRFWPRGERIVAEIEWKTEDAEKPVRMPVEKTALTKGKEMSQTPWVFTGSPMLENFEKEGEMVYGADLYSPNSIASTFNLQNTVFDLPFQGGKTQTYGTFIRNPDVKAPTAQPMLLHLRLAKENEIPKDMDLTVTLSGPDGAVLVEGLEGNSFPGLAEVGAELHSRENEIHYLKPDFGPTLPLGQLTRLARELQLMETHVESIRIEPPVKGQLFYKAFVPDPRYRERSNRPSQPLELHLRKSGGENFTATLIELEEIWSENGPSGINEFRKEMGNPETFLHYIIDQEKENPVLFIYTTGDLLHQTLLSWIGPVLDQFPIVFVYLDED